MPHIVKRIVSRFFVVVANIASVKIDDFRWNSTQIIEARSSLNPFFLCRCTKIESLVHEIDSAAGYVYGFGQNRFFFHDFFSIVKKSKLKRVKSELM